MHCHSLTRIIGLSLILFVIFSAQAIAHYAVSTPPSVYWHAASEGLPSDVQALVAHPSHPGTPSLPTTLYAGTWGSGIYRSMDNGATWLTATVGITLPIYVSGGLAVNPVTPTILFAGDYYGTLSGVGIYRSTNDGGSWTVSLADANIETLLVHPLTPTLVLAGDREDGLYLSVDGGDTWQTTSLPAPRIQALAAASSPPGSIYAGADDELYLSGDGGISWTLASTLASTVESLTVHPITPTLIYAGTRSHGVWRSADGGASWITQTVGLPPDAWVTSIALHPITPTTLYAGVWSGQVYRSQDGGDSWEGLGYLGAVQDVLVHPTAPSVIYAATSNSGVFRGSTLDHLTMKSVDSPQYVNHSFPITVTARDELGFPLIGTSGAQQATLTQIDPALAGTLTAGGFDETAALTDTTGTVSPTSVTFVDGVALADAVISTPVSSDTITATLPGSLATSSNPFDVTYAPVAGFGFDPISNQTVAFPFTITLTALDVQGLPTFYTGTNTLTDTTGTLTPAHTGPFVNGSWSGQITITQAYTEVVITTIGGFATGTSNAFAVVSNTADHLSILPRPMPNQVAGKPFTLTVRAEDPSGNPAHHYNGIVTLTDSTYTLQPVTASLSAGVWSGWAVINEAQYDVVITATADALSTTSTVFHVAYPPALQVNFEGKPRRGHAPLTVRFTSTVTGTVDAYSWNFGDLDFANTPHPTHTYRSAGDFDVTLTVTGPGGTAVSSKPSYIAVRPASGAPTATFSADVTSGTVPLGVTFTAVTSGTVESWLWGFGDGGMAVTGPVISHTYAQTGSFDVSLVVSNSYGSYLVNKPNLIHVTWLESNPRLYLPVVIKGGSAR